LATRETKEGWGSAKTTEEVHNMRSVKWSRSGRLVASSAIVLLAVSACTQGSGATSTPTAAAPSQAASMTAEPPSPTAKSGTMRIAIEAPVEVVYLPTYVALDRLTAMGYTVETTLFDAPETMTQAAASGDIDVGSTSAGTVFASVDAGLDARAFMGLANNSFVMVSKKEYPTCQSLDGKRVGVHSVEGTTGTLTKVWLEKECPSAKPDILIVPGSPNRLAALLANQLDASPLDIPSAIQLLDEKPDDFVLIESFGNVDVVGSYFYGTRAWLSANTELAKDFAKVYSDVIAEISSDPTPILQKAAELIPETDAETMKKIAKVWIDGKIWDPIGAVQDDRVTSTIAFYGTSSTYEHVKVPADVVDSSIVP
jgi:ABC-type nitrate/sulfonate/bicarbonate transport system substrate-binding protein